MYKLLPFRSLVGFDLFRTLWIAAMYLMLLTVGTIFFPKDTLAQWGNPQGVAESLADGFSGAGSSGILFETFGRDLRVSGIVTYADGTPAPGARVSISDSWSMKDCLRDSPAQTAVTTDSNGSYAISNVIMGKYRYIPEVMEESSPETLTFIHNLLQSYAECASTFAAEKPIVVQQPGYTFEKSGPYLIPTQIQVDSAAPSSNSAKPAFGRGKVQGIGK